MKNDFSIRNIIEKHGLFNKDSENIVIGSVLNSTVKIEEVLLYLKPNDFNFDINKRIFACMVNLYTKRMPIDPIIVLDELLKDKNFSQVLGSLDINEYIETISKYSTVGSIIETHANIIKEYSIRREALNVANVIIKDATNKSIDLGVLFDNVQNKASSIELTYRNKNLTHISDILKEINHDVQNENFIKNNLIKSGFEGLDKIIQGFNKSDFVIIGARPSVGKTAFALNIVNNLCFKQNRSVGFFTLEMPSKSIVRRLISLNADIEYYKIYSNLMNKNELIAYNKSLSELNNLSLYIESTQGIQIYELKAQARQMKKNSNVEIIFIDYISLITMSHNDIPRFEQVAFLSRTIRALALELEIPIIVLSQVTRSTEGKEPSLATLRESGALEQDADIVIFLHQENKEYRGNNNTLNDDAIEVKVKVAKHRNGATGALTMDFVPKFTKFIDKK